VRAERQGGEEEGETCLQELHEEEPEDADRETRVVRTRVDIVGQVEAKG